MTDQKNYDSQFCGRVPLNQTNMVQPYGVLMLVAKDNWQILQVSENVEALLGKTAPEAVNTSFAEYISAEQKESLEKRLAEESGRFAFTFSFGNKRELKDFTALVQAHNDYLVFEIELAADSDAQKPFIEVYQELKQTISGIDAAISVEHAAALLAKELKRLSGFDKIMIYQFDEDWNGTVIAEEMAEGMDSYLGLKFPASDIPKQAREMYRTNPYRLIPDADYKPVKLYPVINPVTHAFTDLSVTNLRSVAGVHIEYLHNMRVTASMSTRILKGGQLWGLISCHHRTAKYLSYQACSLFELLSDLISARLTALDYQQEALFKTNMHLLYAQVVQNIYKGKNLHEGLMQQQQKVLDLLKADGVAVVDQKEIKTFGLTPSHGDIENLVFWLQTKGVTAVYPVTSLAAQYEGAEAFVAEASGMLALPIKPESGAFILAFRPEAVRNVAWGGNPDEAITFTEDKKGYHPRNSFNQWQQTVKKQALPWTGEELEMAENFRNFVQAFSHSKN